MRSFLSMPGHRRLAGLMWLATLTACGGGGDTGGVPPAATDPRTVLAAPLGRPAACTVTLTPTTAAPGDRIMVSGLPPDLGEPGIRVIARSASGDTVGAAYFQPVPSGLPQEFAAPIHPATPLSGGALLIEIGDGTRHCPAVPLQVTGLPDRDPAFALTVVDLLEAWVDASIRVMGADPAALATATADTVAPDLVAFAIAKRLLAADAGRGSLREQAQQSVSTGDRVLAGLFAAAGLDVALASAVAQLDAIPTPIRDPAVAPRRKDAAVAKNALCAGQQFPPNPLRISNAAELSARMLAAEQGYLIEESGFTRIGQLLGTAGVSTSGAPASAANTAGNALFVIKTVEGARRALEPKRITAYSVRDADTLLIEDRPLSRPGRWEVASVRASGDEFNISNVILDGLVNSLGLIPGPVGTVVSVASVGGAVQINNAINELTRDACIKIEAPLYGPIDVSDEEWTEATIEGASVERLSHRTYRGIALGTSELRVRLRGEKFGEIASAFVERRAIAVNPQILSLLPSFARVEQPGDIVEISATIANSEVDKANLVAEITSAGGQPGVALDHVILSRQRDGDLFTVRVKTAQDREQFPVQITFDTLNPTLPPDDRARIATIDTGGKLELSSSAGCLTPGTEFELTATLTGFRPNERGVNLQVSGGTLVSQTDNQAVQRIVVRAGQPGTVQVRATSRADSSLSEDFSAAVSLQCLRKIHYSGGGFSGGGIGTDSDGGEGCPPYSTVDSEAILLSTAAPEDVVIPPQIPPPQDLWVQRSEQRSALFSTDFTAYREGDPQCRSARFNGSTQGELRIYAEPDGTLGLRLQADLAGNCRYESEEPNGCAASSANGVMNGFSYLEITQDTPVRVEGELRCAGLSGFVEVSAFSGLATRFENGTTPYLPVGGNGDSLIRGTDGQPRTPVLWVAQCTAADQVIPFDETFIFKAPRQVGGTDLIVIQSSGFANIAITGIEKAGFGPLVDPQNPQPPPLPRTGSYRSTGDLLFRVRVAPQ